ncbi:rhodanese-like domain-containing protein [Fulvivirga sp. M361]|uniref:rhodanese-like domain-containing protein n=1 Tax=Fulvivirga sp. M361 TaxID=2594266 RepID=UPI00117BCB67|nr:rhodanese-like domain-containing protein [Fulvivirga sp. M361]TRX54865.1 rhodanese-like domain-containing protein [Fulvivirga sp. M361]
MRSTILTLGIIMVAFFALLIIVTSGVEKSSFKHSAQEMHRLATTTDYVILPSELAKMPEYRLIDLRKPKAFIIAHKDGALNIPVSNILDDEFKMLFASAVPKVFLAHDPIHAHETWMLLSQLGYQNLLVMELLEED